tara:strand:- start:9613 stop:10767 length:1155 start_codon:yes stop_codon:yes gene_type:complete
MIVKNLKDIEKLKNLTDLDSVTIYSKKIKYNSLFHYALKYAFWSLKNNGILTIYDNGPFEIAMKPYKINIYQINQILFQFLKDSITLIDRDFKKGKIICIINKPNKIKSSFWSCGIIYSGKESEKKQLLKCLDGIYNQSQFNDDESEVIVCAPETSSYSFLEKYPANNLRVVFFDQDNKDRRFLISRKKNFLIKSFKNENCIVLHTRIVFDKNALDNLPCNFEYISPYIYTKNKFKEVRYLDFLNNGSYDPTRISKNLIIARNYPPKEYLKYLKYGLPFIDGGIIISKKSILVDCPLNNNLAWFENEDVELASRIHANGYLIDYAYNVRAFSSSNKVISLADKYPFINHPIFNKLLLYRNKIKSFSINFFNMLSFYFKRVINEL